MKFEVKSIIQNSSVLLPLFFVDILSTKI